MNYYVTDNRRFAKGKRCLTHFNGIAAALAYFDALPKANKPTILIPDAEGFVQIFPPKNKLQEELCNLYPRRKGIQ